MSPADLLRAYELLEVRGKLDLALQPKHGCIGIRLSENGSRDDIYLYGEFNAMLDKAARQAVLDLRAEITKTLNALGVFDVPGVPDAPAEQEISA